MATPVYSTLFIAARGVNINAGYVVPAGFVAVVRDIEIAFLATPNNTAADVLDHATSTILTYHLQLNPFEEHHWEGRQVVDTGAEILASSAGPADTSIRVSGYLLTLP
jgi:hypothetical protein